MAKKAALCKHVHHLICVRVIDLRALHEWNIVIENVYKILVRKPEGETLFLKLRPRWTDNIKINIKEMVCKDVNWFRLTQGSDDSTILLKRQ
jgi:hypothetical protein